MGAENANGFLGFLLLCGTGWEAAGVTQGLLQPVPAGQVIHWFSFETCTLVQELCLEDLQWRSCSLALCFGCIYSISVVIKIHYERLPFPFQKWLSPQSREKRFIFEIPEGKQTSEIFLGVGIFLFVCFSRFFAPQRHCFLLVIYKCNFWLLLQRYFETSIPNQPWKKIDKYPWELLWVFKLF